MTELTAQNINVTLGLGVSILRSVSLAVQPGHVTGLIGPNGAGKTTLLNVMAGLISPTKGQVLFDGTPLDSIPLKQRGQQIGYLEQNAPCHWPLSVERLVMLGRTPHLKPFSAETSDDRAEVASALNRCEVADLSTRNVLTLSGGERARVMLARVLAGVPKVLLADEPTAGLDPYHQLHVMELLQECARDGVAVVIVLHDLTLAARYCDRICLLSAGTVAAEGPPDDIFSGDVISDVYGVSTSVGQRDGETYVIPWRRVAAPSTITSIGAPSDPAHD